MTDKIHDHTCIPCFSGEGECQGNCHIADINAQILPGSELYTGVDGMRRYIAEAVQRGYKTDLIVNSLVDEQLAYEVSRVWQWYNMGGDEKIVLEAKAICREYQRRVGAGDALTPHDMEDWSAHYRIVETANSDNMATLAAAAEPLIKWINENANPHTLAIVQNDRVDLCSMEIGIPIDKFIKD